MNDILLQILFIILVLSIALIPTFYLFYKALKELQNPYDN